MTRPRVRIPFGFPGADTRARFCTDPRAARGFAHLPTPAHTPQPAISIPAYVRTAAEPPAICD